ncbi:hypothetical protein ADICYQ_1877 [Cyclobacterium qasimii M12-11B]|uniref:Uncharacterized protein n=1 Tax=Cyclobacterium qasimii M12-11B TaxID=641524 RepID=S7VFX6_9BACT|nr:hypothetical protein ADICYQ_1877 [Cyclobacterium qasimii M12-11B]
MDKGILRKKYFGKPKEETYPKIHRIKNNKHKDHIYNSQ